MSERRLLLSEEEQFEIAVHLFREDLFGIKEDPTEYKTLKSGRLTPHYLDIRPGISNIATRDTIRYVMADLARFRTRNYGFREPRQAYEHFAGIPAAMTSYAPLIADFEHMSLL